MSFPDRRTANVVLTILLFAAVLTVAYLARAVIVIFSFGILFAYLIDPVVQFIQRHSLLFKGLRGPHVAEAYLVLLILAALAVHGLAPGSLVRKANALQELSTLTERLPTGDVATDLANKYGWSSSQESQLKTFLVRHGTEIHNLINSVEQLATAAFAALVVTPILAAFFLSSGGAAAAQVIRLISTERNYESLTSLATELHTMLQHYMRATVTLGALSLAYASVALVILGFPHAIALGVLAGILEFIPMAGWITAASIILTVGILTQAHWMCMAVLLVIWRLLMDYWIAPRVLRHELEIPPLLAIFTLMVGATVGGISGIYLSIPIVAAIRLVWRRLGRPQARIAAKASKLIRNA